MEETNATWSGENSIGSTEGIPVPFIALKRKFQGDTPAIIKHLTDNCRVVDAKQVDNNITGTAFNASTVDESTVAIDILLKKDDAGDLWSVYHGGIKFRKPKKPEALSPDAFESYDFASLARNEEGTGEVTDTPSNNAILATLGITPPEQGNTADGEYAVKKKRFYAYIGKVLTTNGAGPQQNYYPLSGIMNPHPPYEAGTANAYKNAVSGDFDLFAFWPARTLSDVTVELLRMSEIKLRQDLKHFFDLDQTFGLDFIPGFNELEEGGLKESAETGNINGLGRK
jgi:hypothetical protein